MLVAELRELNAKLHAFLRATDDKYTRKGTGPYHGGAQVDFTIRTNDTYSSTTYTDTNNRTPLPCGSSPADVAAFFQNTSSPMRATIREIAKTGGGIFVQVQYGGNTLKFKLEA
jgi:hypothetical protein